MCPKGIVTGAIIEPNSEIALFPIEGNPRVESIVRQVMVSHIASPES